MTRSARSLGGPFFPLLSLANFVAPPPLGRFNSIIRAPPLERWQTGAQMTLASRHSGATQSLSLSGQLASRAIVSIAGFSASATAQAPRKQSKTLGPRPRRNPFQGAAAAAVLQFLSSPVFFASAASAAPRWRGNKTMIFSPILFSSFPLVFFLLLLLLLLLRRRCSLAVQILKANAHAFETINCGPRAPPFGQRAGLFAKKSICAPASERGPTGNWRHARASLGCRSCRQTIGPTRAGPDGPRDARENVLIRMRGTGDFRFAIETSLDWAQKEREGGREIASAGGRWPRGLGGTRLVPVG